MKFFSPVMLLALLWINGGMAGLSSVSAPIVADFIVAADGSGDFKTVQEAIDAIPDFRKVATTVYIRNGQYKEKIVMPESKQNVRFRGESLEGVIITNDDYSSKKNRFGEEMGTSGSSGFYIYGINIRFDDISFRNTAGPVGQAVAVFVAGDKVQFHHCRFLGFQDTLYTYGKESRQYYHDCYIEGTVDFIFGSSTAVFDSCTLFGKGKGYFTAASTPEQRGFGYVFLHCRITGDGGAGSFLLGRPWRPYAKTAFLYCTIDSVVAPAGWSNWGKESNEHSTLYAEYGNRGEGAAGQERVKWARQLTAEEAAAYTVKNVLGDWDPDASL